MTTLLLLLLLLFVAATGATMMRKQVEPIVSQTTGLRVVNLREDLQPIEQKPVDERMLTEMQDPLRLVDYPWNKLPPKVLAHYTNLPITETSHGSLLFAFLKAYNNHEDVTLSPDDVWMTILFQFAREVNKHPIKYRDQLVCHKEGKITLTVITGEQLEESEWEDFFKLMIEKIKEYTQSDVVETLQSNFSTTTLIESMISTATVMDTTKQFFDFGRTIPMCGIKNVHFAGTLEDWQLVLTKYKALGEKFNFVMEGVDNVLQEFVETYQGNVNTEFWDKIMDSERGSRGSGAALYFSGWILSLYNHKPGSRVEMDNINHDYTVDVPVKLDNKITGITKMVRLRAKFGGLNKKDGSYRPQLSMVVHVDDAV